VQLTHAIAVHRVETLKEFIGMLRLLSTLPFLSRATKLHFQEVIAARRIIIDYKIAGSSTSANCLGVSISTWPIWLSTRVWTASHGTGEQRHGALWRMGLGSRKRFSSMMTHGPGDGQVANRLNRVVVGGWITSDYGRSAHDELFPGADSQLPSKSPLGAAF
jgi:hypothetical protein